MENHYKDGFWSVPGIRAEDAPLRSIVDAINDRTHFGVQYDPSNAIVAGDDPIELLRKVADRVVSMHASDRYLADGASLEDLRQSDGTLGYSTALRHGVTGKGLNDYDTIFTHPGGRGLPGLGKHRGWNERNGGNGRVIGFPSPHVRTLLLRCCSRQQLIPVITALTPPVMPMHRSQLFHRV